MKISSYCLSNLYKNKIYDDDAFSLNKTVQEIISKACKIKENIEEEKNSRRKYTTNKQFQTRNCILIRNLKLRKNLTNKKKKTQIRFYENFIKKTQKFKKNFFLFIAKRKLCCAVILHRRHLFVI